MVTILFRIWFFTHGMRPFYLYRWHPVVKPSTLFYTLGALLGLIFLQIWLNWCWFFNWFDCPLLFLTDLIEMALIFLVAYLKKKPSPTSPLTCTQRMGSPLKEATSFWTPSKLTSGAGIFNVIIVWSSAAFTFRFKTLFRRFTRDIFFFIFITMSSNEAPSPWSHLFFSGPAVY